MDKVYQFQHIWLLWVLFHQACSHPPSGRRASPPPTSSPASWGTTTSTPDATSSAATPPRSSTSATSTWDRRTPPTATALLNQDSIQSLAWSAPYVSVQIIQCFHSQKWNHLKKCEDTWIVYDTWKSLECENNLRINETSAPFLMRAEMTHTYGYGWERRTQT